MEKANIQFDKGLSELKLNQIESKYAFHFPPDLREFLHSALPIGKRWVNWRNDPEIEINSRLNWAFDGICFDIEHNNFWMAEWGEKPNDLLKAFEKARFSVQKAPKLIPVFAHRFIPDRPNINGNPVFSVYQTDIIIYGNDLQTYFQNEFTYYFEQEKNVLNKVPRHIEFWSDLVEANE